MAIDLFLRMRGKVVIAPAKSYLMAPDACGRYVHHAQCMLYDATLRIACLGRHGPTGAASEARLRLRQGEGLGLHDMVQQLRVDAPVGACHAIATLARSTTVARDFASRVTVGRGPWSTQYSGAAVPNSATILLLLCHRHTGSSGSHAPSTPADSTSYDPGNVLRQLSEHGNPA